jgi:ribbon-helix-helix CopG family protein
MRTTITLDNGLAADLKRVARQEGKSVSAVIAEALRARLAKREASPKPKPFRLVTVKGGGVQPGVDVKRWRTLEEMADVARWKSGRR